MSDMEAAYKEYAQPVYRFLLTLSGSPEMAEELLQETFYLAIRHIHQYQGKCSLYTWLCQIGKNAWLKELRRKRHYSDMSWDDLTLPSSDLSPEEYTILQEEYRAVHSAIQGLDEIYRDVFILHTFGGIKLREIAVMYGKSESWARVTYFRARQQIIQEVSK